MQIEFEGKMCDVKELAQMAGISRQCLVKRYESGKRGADLIRPLSIRRIRYNDSYLTVAQLASLLGIPKITIYKRIDRGFTDEEIVSGRRNKKK